MHLFFYFKDILNTSEFIDSQWKESTIPIPAILTIIHIIIFTIILKLAFPSSSILYNFKCDLYRKTIIYWSSLYSKHFRTRLNIHIAVGTYFSFDTDGFYLTIISVLRTDIFSVYQSWLACWDVILPIKPFLTSGGKYCV